MRTSFITDRKRIDEIISACDICFVAINGEDGIPYLIPMNFGYDGKEIILHSGSEGTHLELLATDNRVSIVFCSDRKLRCQHPDMACSYSMEAESVVCNGTVTFTDDENLDEKKEKMNIVMKNYSKRTFNYSEPALRNVKVWRVSINTITAKAFGQNFKNTQFPPDSY